MNEITRCRRSAPKPKGRWMSGVQAPICDLADHPEPGPLSGARIAAIAKALAHPARVRILEQFIECQPQIAQRIVDEFDLAQSTMSEHLRLLREAGLLIATPDGPRTWYCMRRAVLRQFAAAILDLTGTSAISDDG